MTWAVWGLALCSEIRRQARCAPTLEDELLDEVRQLHDLVAKQAQTLRQADALLKWHQQELTNRNETISAMVEAVEWQVSGAYPPSKDKRWLH